MVLIWLSGQGEADDFIFLMTFISLYVGFLRLNSFVGRLSGLSYDGIVKSCRDDFERLF